MMSFAKLSFCLLFTSLLVLFITGCSSNPSSGFELKLEGSWQQVGEEEASIRSIRRHNNRLYLATDTTGLFVYNLSSRTDEWISLGLENATIRDVIVWDSSEILASAFHPDSSIYIFKTTNGGNSWQSFQNGFGKEYRRAPMVLKQHPDSSNILYASAGGAIVKSMNRGKYWQPIHLGWGYIGLTTFIKFEAQSPKYMWSGGFTAFGPRLISSEDRGKTWEQLNVIERVETTVYDLIINNSNPKHLLAGLGAGGFRSVNGGKKWNRTLETVAVLALAQSPQDERKVYAGGANAAGSLFFAASGDFGKSWETITWDEGPGSVLINDMIAVMKDGREVLYFGTNKGLYSFTFES